MILGARGQVGRALRVAAPPAWSVTALDRAACDLSRRADLDRTIAEARPDIVFNAAAYTGTDRAESEPGAAALINAQAPGWAAAATRAAGGRFVHLSTDYVFDGSGGRPYRPDDPTNPQSVYGRTKRDGEEAVRSADPAALIVRTAWVYAGSGSNFVTGMLRLMTERERLAIVADQVGTPTYATSLAGALFELAAAGAVGIHHYTDAGVASWYDFAVAIEEEARALGVIGRPVAVRPIATADYPTATRRPSYSVLDKKSTWDLLGRPALHWRANLRLCLQDIQRSG